MKKILLSTLLSFIVVFGFAQTTATNFTCNDCSGNPHTLFNELDAGKVVVLTWTMPCGSCAGPIQSANSVAQSFSSSYPGRVLVYLVDDVGNTTCATLTSWANSNGLSSLTKFSNAAIDMMDYGSVGMPKVVILGGANHTVYYNENDAVNSANMSTAITNALNATTAVKEESIISSYNVFPNPAVNTTTISYALSNASDVTIEIYNLVGATVQTVFAGKQAAGVQQMKLDCSNLTNGFYFVKIKNGNSGKTLMLSVAN